MHILHVNFARGFRGGERQTLNLLTGLAQCGIRQTLVARTGSELAERAAGAGIPVRAFAHPALGHLGAPRADLIHVHEARGAYWAAIEHAARGTPYVLTRRIPTPVGDSRLTRAVYARAARLFGVSADVSARLAAQTGRRVDTVLSCASTLEVDRKAVRTIRGCLGRGPVIGHVGALHDAHKGQFLLLDAFRLLAEDHPEARLVLVGSGPDADELRRRAAGDARIVFAGQQEDVGSWIAAMDVFAFPSREEGLGSSVLDAMQAGVPVVAAAVGGLPELLGRDERGLLAEGRDPVRWAAALHRLVTDAALRRSLTDAARAFALRNDAAAMTRRYLACYRSLLPRMATDLQWLEA